MRCTFLALALALSATHLAAQRAPRSDYLYLWTGSADSTKPDFLAVMDVRQGSRHYAQVVATLPVPGLNNGPHHTEHEMADDGLLFVTGFRSGQSFIFDLRDPLHPLIAHQFGDLAGYMHPHSFVPLPNGDVLATFQMKMDSAGAHPGGLVELTRQGTPVRSVSADAPGVDQRIRPYSSAIIPSLDRVVTTTTSMAGPGPDNEARAVQVWRLSDLSLLRTFDLPAGPHGDEMIATAEPRVLGDGRTVLVSTFSCGLYLMKGLEGNSPTADLVAEFPQKEKTNCAIPVITGHWYLVTVPVWNAVVTLDISDPAHPREVGRLVLPGAQDVPHWISLSPDGRRLVITGYAGMKNRVYLADLDRATGRLTLDPDFHDPGSTEPGVRMDNKTWPDGSTTAGIPHGAVFSRPVTRPHH